jgi:hydrogenase nickel incorporation protein HypB
MCSVCGCGDTGQHTHVDEHGTITRHSHTASAEAHVSAHAHHHHHDEADVGEKRLLRVERDLLEQNDRFAAFNRGFLKARRAFCLNLVSSPGAGKTSLLTRTLADLKGELKLVAIEGDQQTTLDADRIRATGVAAVQINTGRGCHLDAEQVGLALERLDPPNGSVVFVENVGNLVCPAGFDLGEAHKVVLASVTEGEDKPLKYPDMFAAARLMLVTKIDLLPHLDFDMARLIASARQVNPDIQVLCVSARSGEGLMPWYDWLRAGRAALQPAAAGSVDA